MLKYIKSFFEKDTICKLGTTINASRITRGIGNIQSEGHGSYRGLRM